MRLETPEIERKVLFGRALLASLQRGDDDRTALFARAFLHADNPRYNTDAIAAQAASVTESTAPSASITR